MAASSLSVVNGRVVDVLPVGDRGCLYGDGVFRTVRVTHGTPCWWQDQLARLSRDAARLAIPCPAPDRWEQDLGQLPTGRPEGVLRLTLTRGEGNRGYRPPGEPTPNRIVSWSALPGHYDAVAATGARVRLCALRLAPQPHLAGIKHLNRLENVLARMEWSDSEIHEGLLMDTQGRIVGGVSSNLFIFQGGELLTPRLTHGGVAGVARDRTMAAARRLALTVREADLTLESVYDAREVMLTNSLMRVWPVARLQHRVWHTHDLAHTLRELLDD